MVHHRLPEVFGTCFAAGVLQRDFASRTVIHHDVSMIDGDISHALLEITDRVPSSCHDFADEPIRFRDGAIGIINESCLNGAP